MSDYEEQSLRVKAGFMPLPRLRFRRTKSGTRLRLEQLWIDGMGNEFWDEVPVFDDPTPQEGE